MFFAEKWQAAQRQNNSRLVIGLAPRLQDMPLAIMRYDDPFLPFGRAIIECTAEFACAYALDLASYLALGAAGARALERTIPLIPRHLPIILHAPFFTADYAKASFEEAFAVDAVTLANGDPAVVRPYIENAAHGAFVIQTAYTPLAKNVGWYAAGHFCLYETPLAWITDPIIYASAQEDFQDQARQQANFFRQQSI